MLSQVLPPMSLPLPEQGESQGPLGLGRQELQRPWQVREQGPDSPALPPGLPARTPGVLHTFAEQGWGGKAPQATLVPIA